jgi:hypothetical protein
MAHNETPPDRNPIHPFVTALNGSDDDEESDNAVACGVVWCACTHRKQQHLHSHRMSKRMSTSPTPPTTGTHRLASQYLSTSLYHIVEQLCPTATPCNLHAAPLPSNCSRRVWPPR